MRLFQKLFKGPEIDMEKSNANAKKMRALCDPTYYRRSEILKAYRNKYPTDAFVIYPDKKGYIAINAYDWLEDESLYVSVSQEEELAAFTDFFLNRFATK